jgi:hypothetical protein
MFFLCENWVYKFRHWKGEWGSSSLMFLYREKHTKSFFFIIENEGFGLLFAGADVTLPHCENWVNKFGLW